MIVFCAEKAAQSTHPFSESSWPDSPEGKCRNWARQLDPISRDGGNSHDPEASLPPPSEAEPAMSLGLGEDPEPTFLRTGTTKGTPCRKGWPGPRQTRQQLWPHWVLPALAPRPHPMAAALECTGAQAPLAMALHMPPPPP